MSRNVRTRSQHSADRQNLFTQKVTGPNPILRAREPINRSFGLIRGKFPSSKMGRMIHWESQLERDAVYLFEFSPGVVRFREQPFSTYYALDANTRRYTPDFELTLYTGETTLIEIKPEEKLLDRDERRRLDCIHEHFVSKGHEYRILTERDIRQQELLKNLGMLMRHRGIPLTSYQRRLIEKRLIDISSISFANGAALLGDIASVWHLIDQRILFCDLRRLINQETIFSTIPNERFNEILLF